MELPGIAQEIADVIGRERALFLIGQLPRSGSRKWRTCLYVPKRVSVDHPLVALIGWADANKLCREFGGMILQPSNCSFLARDHRTREVRRMRADGMSLSAIADAVDLTERQIRNIIAETPPEEIAPLNDNMPANEKVQGGNMRGGD